MLGILVQSREAPPRLNRAKLQRERRIVPSTFDATPRGDRLPKMPVGLANAARDPSPSISAGTPLSIGSLLYLGCVGLIAAGIVAVFFGVGFSLLVPTAAGTISGLPNRAGPEAMSPLPSLGSVEQQTSLTRASAGEKDAALNSAAYPVPTEVPGTDGQHDVPHLDGALASKVPADTPVAPANAPVPAPKAPAAIALAAPSSGFSGAEMAELLAHGDFFCATAISLRHACFTSARPVPAMGRQRCASERPSIRNFSGASALASCKPIRPRPNHGTAVLATSAR